MDISRGVLDDAAVADNNVLGTILRSAVQFELRGSILSVRTIDDAVRGEGHFLGQAETLQRMTSGWRRRT